jgi:hypothetical protein
MAARFNEPDFRRCLSRFQQNRQRDLALIVLMNCV